MPDRLDNRGAFRADFAPPPHPRVRPIFTSGTCVINRTFPLALLSLAFAACAPAVAPSTGPTPDQPRAGTPPLPAGPLDAPPESWWLLDEPSGRVFGTATERAYREILAGRQPARSVVVAVLDSGIEIDHPDLIGSVWTNSDEVAGNGVDDDRNGYVDDVHGWNFIGGRDGRNVEQDTYEMTRLYQQLQTRFAAVRPDTLSAGARADYELALEAAEEYRAELAEKTELLEQIEGIATVVKRSTDILKAHLGTDSLSEARVAAIQPNRADVAQAQSIYLQMARQGITEKAVEGDLETLREMVEYNLNPEFDPRPIVGDDYDDLTQRVYGNNDVEGPTSEHGTHVAGIIAATRGNGIGIDGIASAAQIMSVRTVPDGDERDKDVANAIRYAVDNGAHIINMSFGKGYSPEKEAVDAAVAYAQDRGVLVVHAAGNDAEDLTSEANFPTRALAAGGIASNWIEVGATSWEAAPDLVATFSNYGQRAVDVFAPGVDIRSTVPEGLYEENSGTSMAAPVVSGIAALIMAYYPDLTAEQVRQIILESATRHADVRVDLPGGSRDRVPFGTLSVTGGIVNAYEALRLAAQTSRQATN
jgi:subtilisin family serine protease